MCAKWRIPRHKPKGYREWEMEDKNHGKRFVVKSKLRREKARQQRLLETRFLNLVTKQANTGKAEIATMQIGQCSRKVKLSREDAFHCCRSAAIETGRDMYGYKCRWCGQYHITSHPIAGVEYPISIRGLKPGEKSWNTRKEDRHGQVQ